MASPIGTIYNLSVPHAALSGSQVIELNSLKQGLNKNLMVVRHPAYLCNSMVWRSSVDGSVLVSISYFELFYVDHLCTHFCSVTELVTTKVR